MGSAWLVEVCGGGCVGEVIGVGGGGAGTD